MPQLTFCPLSHHIKNNDMPQEEDKGIEFLENIRYTCAKNNEIFRKRRMLYGIWKDRNKDNGYEAI